MVCPTCGGSERMELAPGYYRCSSVVVDRFGGPGQTDPRRGPMVIEKPRICGAEYQEGTPSMSDVTCWCGTFPVGRCTRCEVPVCGYHSDMSDRGRLCGNCLESDRNAAAAKQAQIAAQQAAEVNDRKARHEQAVSAWAAETLRLLAEDPWPARICRAMRAVTQYPGSPTSSPLVDVDLLKRLILELLPSRTYLPQDSRWDEHEIASWFAHAAKTSANAVEVYRGSNRRRGKKQSAWVFAGGSTQRWQSPDSSLSYLRNAAVSARGDRLYELSSAWTDMEPELSGDRFVGRDRFGPKAFVDMANMAQLPPLPPCPSA